MGGGGFTHTKHVTIFPKWGFFVLSVYHITSVDTNIKSSSNKHTYFSTISPVGGGGIKYLSPPMDDIFFRRVEIFVFDDLFDYFHAVCFNKILAYKALSVYCCNHFLFYNFQSAASICRKAAPNHHTNFTLRMVIRWFKFSNFCFV